MSLTETETGRETDLGKHRFSSLFTAQGLKLKSKNAAQNRISLMYFLFFSVLRSRAFFDLIDSDRYYKFLFLRIFACADLRFFRSTGIHLSGKGSRAGKILYSFMLGFCLLVFASPETRAVSLGTVIVMIDHARIVRLPEKTSTVVVGNPIVADVTVQRNGILVVTGKSYGITNLIALDNSGNMLAESMIRVQAPNEAVVTVQRGLERESYSCTPHCQPAIQLGDSQRHFGEVSAQAGQRNSLAGQR
jgi:hypothetical protein